MTEHQEEQHDPMQAEFHPAVTEDDLVDTDQDEALHPYQHAEREDPQALREELSQKQDRARLVQSWIGQNEQVRPQLEAPVAREQSMLSELRQEIAAGPSPEVVAEGQALIDKAQQAIDRFDAEEHTPDERLVAEVAAAKEKLEEWILKIEVINYPSRQSSADFYNRHHKDDADFELKVAKEPEPPATEITDNERASIESDKGVSVKERLEKALQKAQNELQASEREDAERRKATANRLKEELSNAHTKASELKRAYIDGLRGLEPSRVRSLEDAQTRLSENKRRAAEHRAELAAVQTDIQHIEARLKAAEAASGKPQTPDAAAEEANN